MASVSAPSKAGTKQKARELKLTAADRRALDMTFSIDTRALAVVRILLAGFILYEALFLDWSTSSDPNPFVDFLYQNSNLVIVPFAVMMLVGYKTRFAVALCWIVYSIPQRNDLLSGGAVDMGDYITVVLLLWLTLLPLGRHLAVDGWRHDTTPARFLSVASGGIIFQIFVIYFSAGLLKDINEWVIEATAMEYVLSHPLYETALGTALLDYPAVLAVMSVATIFIEVLGALLVIVPGKTLEKRRMIVVPAFIFLHIGIAALMGIGLFPLVMIAAWLLFLPPRFWDWLWAKFSGTQSAVEPDVDRNRWRNGVAGALVLVMLISNVLSWLYHPTFDGFSAYFQDFTLYLLMYQRWAMFPSPSTLPL